MKAVFVLLCLVGSSVGRPMRSVKALDMVAGPSVVPPKGFQEQMPQTFSPPIPQPPFFNVDLTYGNVPLMPQETELPTVSGQQPQIFPGLNYPPFQQQPGLSGGPTYLPATQLISPLADTDFQPQIYTVIIQQPVMAGSVSSEEPQQQSILYLLSVIPAAERTAVTQSFNGGVELLNPRGILPNPGTPTFPDVTAPLGGDPAPQGTSHPVEGAVIHGGNSPVPESGYPASSAPAGVQQQTQTQTQTQAGSGTGYVPCAGEGANPTEYSRIASPTDTAIFEEPAATVQAIPEGFKNKLHVPENQGSTTQSGPHTGSVQPRAATPRGPAVSLRGDFI
ncbi:uncharacterized protein LOC136764242 [Amia ocellicauda]|uniref:uncharacterized protein LOC136764242 n=1 Tax=Amia ocellicauda TaxID=2972642 RepID=UPI003464181B